MTLSRSQFLKRCDHQAKARKFARNGSDSRWEELILRSKLALLASAVGNSFHQIDRLDGADSRKGADDVANDDLGRLGKRGHIMDQRQLLYAQVLVH